MIYLKDKKQRREDMKMMSEHMKEFYSYQAVATENIDDVTLSLEIFKLISYIININNFIFIFKPQIRFRNTQI